MADATITVSNSGYFKAGDNLTISTAYTPHWLRWKRFPKFAYRIERACRRIARRFHREIWVRHESVVVSSVQNTTTMTIR